MASLIRRKKVYYLQHYVAGRIKRQSLRTTSLQVAKEKVRRFESAQARGEDNPLSTRTPLVGCLLRLPCQPRSRSTVMTTVFLEMLWNN